jgi:hypothetical protein
MQSKGFAAAFGVVLLLGWLPSRAVHATQDAGGAVSEKTTLGEGELHAARLNPAAPCTGIGGEPLVLRGVGLQRRELENRTAGARSVSTAQEPVPRGEPMTITLRPAMLTDHIELMAGQRVRILGARVVGVFSPRAFLVESATRYVQTLGLRDRVLVLVDGAALKVRPEVIVGSTVVIVGTARTLLGAQVTAEVPWPTQLDPALVERLEVRAVALATSVQAPEGTELTDSPRRSSIQASSSASGPPPCYE